jgi:LPS sulfotransferase NodH
MGVAGRPEEYFWRDDEPLWSGRFDSSDFAGYVRKVLEEGTTPNGVFGAKVMRGYLNDFLGKLRWASGSRARSAPWPSALLPPYMVGAGCGPPPSL